MAPKRAQTKATAPSAKRAKTSRPEAPLLDFLGKCDEIPKSCREMLQVSVPICLEVVEAERHKLQVEVLERVAALLATVEGKKREHIAAVKSELKETETERDGKKADSEAKKATSASKQAECEEKGTVVGAAKEVLAAAEKVLVDSTQAQEDFNTKKDGLGAEQDNFAKLLSETFQPLKEGTFQGKGAQKTKAMTELKKKLVELGAQESLGDALVATLKLPMEKRDGSFATVMLKFVEEAFSAHTAKVAQDIAGLDTEAATHSSAITAAEASIADKKAALEVVQKEYDELQAAWMALEAEATQAARALKSVEVRIPRVEKSIDKAEADLEKFMEVPALFSKLKEKSTAVPDEPEEAEATQEQAKQDADMENATDNQGDQPEN